MPGAPSGGSAANSGFIHNLPDIDIFRAEYRLAIVEIKLPQLLEAVVETERHDLFP